MNAASETKSTEKLDSAEAASNRSLELESVGAGAAGGAALASVIALSMASGLAFGPLIGAAIAAGAGVGIGHLAKNAIKKERSER
jgi:hypothetical protein